MKQLNEIKVGQKFIWNDHIYTKLNEDNLCFYNGYKDGQTHICRRFDGKSNDYENSEIKEFVENDFLDFITKTEEEKANILDITLLSKEEYLEYEEFIEPKFWFWLRSAGNSTRSVCYVDYDGYVYDYYDFDYTDSDGSVCPVLHLKSSILVSEVE